MVNRLLKYSFLALLLSITLTACEKKEKEYQAIITTEFGDITIKLFNSTPKHRDNFIKLVNEGFYNDLLFHRVIDNFMIQGGDPSSKGATMGAPLGMGGPGYEIDAEIGAPHIRGALAAARTSNPEKRSSGSQFYIVTGKQQTENDINRIEEMKKIKYNEVQRDLYIKQGGFPGLDMEYTVFGQVVSGMEVVDKIGKVSTDERDRPTADIKMSIKMVDK